MTPLSTKVYPKSVTEYLYVCKYYSSITYLYYVAKLCKIILR